MRRYLAVLFLAMLSGSATAQWRNAPPGSQMCRDANGRSYLSEGPCPAPTYRCYDDRGKLYSSAEPCPKPREVSAAEREQKQAQAEKRREQERARLKARDPVAWKKLEEKAGGDLSKCQVYASVDKLHAMCPRGEQTQSLR